MNLQQVQTLVRQCALGLFDLACSVSGHPHWDLSLPVMIDARKYPPKLLVTPIGTINSIVKASATLGHPLIQRFYERAAIVGFELSLTEAISGPDSDSFAEIWQAYKEERLRAVKPYGASRTPQALSCAPNRARRARCRPRGILPGEPLEVVTLHVPIAFLTQR